jgi:hypothetical protein
LQPILNPPLNLPLAKGEKKGGKSSYARGRKKMVNLPLLGEKKAEDS